MAGSVTITWDSSGSVTNTTTGLTVNSLNFSLGATVGFNCNQGNDDIIIGAMQNGVDVMASNTDDFGILIHSASGTPVGQDMIYSCVGSDVNFAVASSTITSETPAPEPTSMAIRGMSLVGLGIARRQSKGRVAALYTPFTR